MKHLLACALLLLMLGGARAAPVTATAQPATVRNGQSAAVTLIVTNTNAPAVTTPASSTATVSYTDGTEVRTASAVCDLSLVTGGLPWSEVRAAYPYPSGFSLVPNSITIASPSGASTQTFPEAAQLRLTCTTLQPGQSWITTFRIQAPE